MYGRFAVAAILVVMGSAHAADVLPPDVRALEAKVDGAEARLSELQQQIGMAQRHQKAADARLRAVTLMLVKAQRYPQGFWAARALLEGTPATVDVVARVASQGAAEVNRMGSDVTRLRKLYGEANSQIEVLRGVQDTYGAGRKKLTETQKQALSVASVKADDLAVRLQEISAGGDADALEPLDMVSLTAVLEVPELVAKTAIPEKPQAMWKGGLPLVGKVVQGFRAGKGATAEGVVLRAPQGTEVQSMVNGEVLYSGPFRKFGGLVIVKAASGEDVLYGGLGTLSVSTGDTVRAGQLVGTLDREGQLYWEIRRRGRVVNPLAFR